MILTKHQAAEIATRVQIDNKIKNILINYYTELPQHKLVKELRKATDLNFCSFAPGMVVIKYKL